MRKRLSIDEWYPVFELLEPYGKDDDYGTIEVSDELWARHEEVMASFHAFQTALKRLRS